MTRGWGRLLYWVWPWACLVALLLVRPSPLYALEEPFTKVTGVRLVPFAQDFASSDAPSAEQTGWALSAEFDIGLGVKLQEAANRGLPLNFTVDFRLLQPRWYWTDKALVDAEYPIVLSYNALTQAYRIEMGNQVLTTQSLQSAVAAMKRLKDWLVVDRSAITLGQTYTAQVRFRLDVDELPRPFQINAFTSSKWILSSDWLEFEFTPRGELPK